MSVTHKISVGAAKAATFAIKHFTKMNASNYPGSVALKIDPACVETESALKIKGKSIVVVGTNGKTSVTNMIADALECSDMSVLCNRSGANMKAGVCTSLINGRKSDVGVFESDELWTKNTLPALSADFLLLLNLFRDQLDRCGEIERIQSSIVEALKRSPKTQLIYNGDDPLCEIVAQKSQVLPERITSPENIPIGIDEPLHWEQNSVSDTTMCQKCDSMLEYEFRQYDKLGKYSCSSCDFKRSSLGFSATNVKMTDEGLSIDIKDAKDGTTQTFTSKLLGSYNAYNMLFCAVASKIMGASAPAIQKCFDNFSPKNGRLQTYSFENKKVLLNLAKNPTGFNQNLRIISSLLNKDVDTTVAFFINDKTADGHDISWIWDCDFEELSDFQDVKFFAGGTRKEDLQVRLKHAEINSDLCDGAKEVLESGAKRVFIIANYTALPEVKTFLDSVENGNYKLVYNSFVKPATFKQGNKQHEVRPIKIAHILPDLLNLYGDGGNVKILKNRLLWRGIPAEIIPVYADTAPNFEDFDIIVMGGSPDREQELASRVARQWRDDLKKHVEAGKPLLAICGSYQMLGETWLLNDEIVPGLGILDIKTDRPGTSADRLVSNIALKTEISSEAVIGFENHAGRTRLGQNMTPFGKVISKVGCGNNEGDMADGVLYKATIGTYLHGPLLSKNPEIADWLLAQALRRCADFGDDFSLSSLDDAQELLAKNVMAQRISA